ncbi:MAG: hypothetical protein QM831_39240 [Kofleriaceae bacterium]
MNRALFVLLVGTAQAGPHHKPDKYAAAAAAEFDKALDAEAKGHLENAIEHYRNAFEMSPHPDPLFNIAVLQTKLDRAHEALIAYARYLELAGSAPDRAQVEAEMDRLANLPRTLTFTPTSPATRIEDSYIVVDGEILTKPGQAKPAKRTLPPGRHYAAAISTLSAGFQELVVTGHADNRTDDIHITAPNHLDGNFAMMLPYALNARVDGKLLFEGKRIQLSPGKHVFTMSEGNDSQIQCPDLVFDVPADGVLFVTVMFDELATSHVDDAALDRCRHYVAKPQHLTFK